MALINCPECGKQVSDKAKNCIHCGYPISEMKNLEAERESKKIKCRYCDSEDIDHMGYCNECGMQAVIYQNKNTEITPTQQNEVEEYTEPFTGIYKYTLFGKKEIYCPRCGSSECSHYREQHVIPGKTKTSYKANLNPFKPFTLIDKKEKVVRKDFEYTEKKIVCHKCGYVFH